MDKVVEFLGSKIGVEKATKSAERDESSLFVKNPEISDTYGVIKYLGADLKNSNFAVGDKVYYGSKVELLRMAGTDIYIMEPENVIAVLKEKTK